MSCKCNLEIFHEKKENKEEIITYGEKSVQFLQRVIDGMSGTLVQSKSDSIDFSRLKKMKISIKKKFGQPYVKCKIRYQDEQETLTDWVEAADPDSEKPDYSSLKKRMKNAFKSMGDRLQNGSFPSHVEMELFCRHARQMTTHSGYGDTMYPIFLQLVNEFENAFRMDDIQKCQEKYAEIDALKTTCHQEG